MRSRKESSVKHARLAAEAVHRKEVPLEEIADVLRDNA